MRVMGAMLKRAPLDVPDRMDSAARVGMWLTARTVPASGPHAHASGDVHNEASSIGALPALSLSKGVGMAPSARFSVATHIA
jgi:hypothetical protein